MSVKFAYSKILLLAFLLTFAVIEARNLLPERTLTIVPSESGGGSSFLLPPFDGSEPKNAIWIDKGANHYQCKFDGGDINESCDFIHIFSSDGRQGFDLSQFERLTISLGYKGSAETLRVAIRNQDARFSRRGDDNSNKFNFVLLKTSEFIAPVVIELSEFKVADWWVNQYKIPRAQLQPDLSNAISLSLDVEGDLRNTEHDIKIDEIEFSGQLISAEKLYFWVISVWLFSGSLFILLRIFVLQKTERIQRKNIMKLKASNSSLRTETDKFRKISTVDALTNAFNRHGIEKIVESLDFRLSSTSIIMFDLDHFKRINDGRGHDAGDRVLQKIGELVLNNTRSTDKFGRWGGEEFILICPATTTDMALALAEKLRLVISQTVFEPQDPLAVSASFGVTTVLANEPFSAAFKRMDEALYRAKHQGRNCVVLAD
jgi:diguanylate cyclase (GGDEF)-like protein